MTKQSVLITGGNSGIGYECALELARQGWQVIIASRNKEASATAVKKIAQETGNNSIVAMELDLGSFSSIRRFVKEIEEKNLPLNALVCNAAVQMNKRLVLSPDGYELTFAVNHLGHFLLTNLLIERLLANSSRIVIVASGVHDPKMNTGMPKPFFSDIDALASTGGSDKNKYNGQLAYVNSKLCNLLFMYELVRQIEKAGLVNNNSLVTVNGYDPGLVPGSGLARDYPPALRFIWDWILPGVAYVLSPMFPTINPVWKSGKALARLVTDPKLKQISGKYFPSYSKWQEAPSSEASYDVELARELWQKSIDMTKLKTKESPLV